MNRNSGRHQEEDKDKRKTENIIHFFFDSRWDSPEAWGFLEFF